MKLHLSENMGTPDRFHQVEEDFKAGRVSAKNLSNKQKAVFLDRDGTINKYVGFLRNINDFELIDGVAEAIKKINASGYLAIVVTNQPVIARGEVTFRELEEIHNRMETELGLQGAYLDAIYYCPHHPHKGYEGEVPELKIECDCRKPKPGMLLSAAGDYNIDLSQSYMIGDGENDVKAGLAAGCKAVLINGEGTDAKNENFGQIDTLSDNGGVTRGICKMDEQNNLTEVVETKNIVKTATGAEADGVAVDVDSLVSMNMWGLTPEFLNVLEEGFKEFFEKEVPGNPLKAEYLIPIFIGELLEQGKMSVKVLKTNDTWYGMTYHEDVAAVKDSFKKMLENGLYKADLFSDL